MLIIYIRDYFIMMVSFPSSFVVTLPLINVNFSSDHGGADITDLIGTMQAALNMDQRPSSARTVSTSANDSAESIGEQGWYLLFFVNF